MFLSSLKEDPDGQSWWVGELARSKAASRSHGDATLGGSGSYVKIEAIVVGQSLSKERAGADRTQRMTLLRNHSFKKTNYPQSTIYRRRLFSSAALVAHLIFVLLVVFLFGF